MRPSVTTFPVMPWLLVLLAAALYHGFLVMLLLSPPDRNASLLFFLNTPVFALWLLWLVRFRRSGALFGVVGAVFQFLIGATLLSVLPGADVYAVVVINGIIVAGFLGLALICSRLMIGSQAIVTVERT